MANAIDEDSLYTRRFSSLSTTDLLEAREQYHVHLVHKANVVATAVGLYLIRDKDEDAKAAVTPGAAKQRGQLGARTLENSRVRPWSWPCVLVFVREWQIEGELAPQHVVPPFLYLEDGRIVPVCVVVARHAVTEPRPIPLGRLDVTQLSGGSPVYAWSQGQRRVGSVGCIVTDGSDYYALTNKHVAGEPGRAIEASLRGAGRRVGTSALMPALGTRVFSEVYEGLPGDSARLQVDAGLIKLESVKEWSPEVSGLGRLGQMYDFSAQTASLDWVGCPVVASGAASGGLEGEVRALFYRYKAVGGREFITDFLIGGRTSLVDREVAPLLTRPGDSGTLWCVDRRAQDEGLRPLALEWGGHRLSSAQGTVVTQFALATSVAVICRELEVDIVTDWDTENTDYWGSVGHFKIAQQACFKVQNPQLREFMIANLDNISFSDDAELEGAHPTAAGFVPLADVPDYVWKTNINRVKREVTRPDENTNHYADVDLPGANGRTLLEMCTRASDLRAGVWEEFWTTAPPPSQSPLDKNGNPKPVSHGCLPFRVWQIFAQMKKFAEQGHVDEFLCAAGLLSHYVGDACQPLHGSQHSNGLNGSNDGVHSTYEDYMVDRKADDIARGIDSAMATDDFPLLAVTSGQEAGFQVVQLMRRSAEALPPEFICETFETLHPGHVSKTKVDAVLDGLWDACGDGTIQCIADGIRVLASLWESAFQNAANDGAAFKGKRKRPALQALYEDPKFLESKLLADYTKHDSP